MNLKLPSTDNKNRQQSVPPITNSWHSVDITVIELTSKLHLPFLNDLGKSKWEAHIRPYV